MDSGHCIHFKKHYYRMLDKNGKQIHFQKGTNVMVIQAFDGNLYTCVNDRDIYALEEIPEHAEYSKDLDPDHSEPRPKKQYIPPMNHPWRRYAFTKFVHSQKHRIEKELREA